MNKNTKAMLTLLAATSITSVAGMTSYANTKFIDTNVSAKQFNDAIEARIREEAEKAALEQENPEESAPENIEGTVSEAVEEAAPEAAEEAAPEAVEEVAPEAVEETAPVIAEISTLPEAGSEVAQEDTSSAEAVASEAYTVLTGSEETAKAVEVTDPEKTDAVIEDVFIAKDSEAVVSSGFIISRNAKTIDTTVAAVTGSTTLTGTVAKAVTGSKTLTGTAEKAVTNNTAAGYGLVDGPDNTPAETYAAPIFSTGKIIISGSSNRSIVTESANVTSDVSDTEEKTNEEVNLAVEEDVETNEELRTRVAAYAASFANGVGKYRYGGTNPYTGADCSGFVQHVLAKTAGVHLSRTSASQATQGQAVGSIDQAKAGDLLFYAKGGRVNHVGIYLGNGTVISASSPSTGMRITAYNYRPVVGIRNVLGN